MKHHDPITPSDAGHGPARGYRNDLYTLRKYFREKDAEGKERSRRSSGGRRKANVAAYRQANIAAYLEMIGNDEDVLPTETDLG